MIAYRVGMRLRFIPANNFDQPIEVDVVGLRKNGSAKLSNGWLADDTGYCEGTQRVQGGRVEKVEQ